MGHSKIEPNIYHDERCTKKPYFVNIMRNGHTLYKKCATLEQAQQIKEDFVKLHSFQNTDHPFVFIRKDKYEVRIMVEKRFVDYEEACKKADIILKFMDK